MIENQTEEGTDNEMETENIQWFTGLEFIHSRKLTWKPKKGSIKTTVLLKGSYMGFHVSLEECSS